MMHPHLHENHQCTHTPMHLHTYMRPYLHTYTSPQIYTCIYIDTCMHAYSYNVHMHIHTYMSIHTCIHARLHNYIMHQHIIIGHIYIYDGIHMAPLVHEYIHTCYNDRFSDHSNVYGCIDTVKCSHIIFRERIANPIIGCHCRFIDKGVIHDYHDYS